MADSSPNKSSSQSSLLALPPKPQTWVSFFLLVGTTCGVTVVGVFGIVKQQIIDRVSKEVKEDLAAPGRLLETQIGNAFNELTTRFQELGKLQADFSQDRKAIDEDTTAARAQLAEQGKVLETLRSNASKLGQEVVETEKMIENAKEVATQLLSEEGREDFRLILEGVSRLGGNANTLALLGKLAEESAELRFKLERVVLLMARKCVVDCARDNPRLGPRYQACMDECSLIH